jgi:hypothetical protein
MAIAHDTDEAVTAGFVRFHHGTDLASANNLLKRGVDSQQAAAWNGSGEFWATFDHQYAGWFALSNPSSPPAACFEFDLPEAILIAMLQMIPPVVLQQLANDYEFLTGSHAMLNRNMVNGRVVLIP